MSIFVVTAQKDFLSLDTSYLSNRTVLVGAHVCSVGKLRALVDRFSGSEQRQICSSVVTIVNMD